jgi:DnaJ domain
MVSVAVNQKVHDEITRLVKVKNLDAKMLEEFAHFVIQNSENNTQQSISSLRVSDLKQAIYSRFNVRSTEELKKSGAFRSASIGIDSLNFRSKKTWEILYRKFIGILPGEENQEGYGCINGVNIFAYFKPWQVFALNPKTATKNDIKDAYYRLSKIYHPDNPKTGDRKIFEKIEVMYRSIIAGVK